MKAKNIKSTLLKDCLDKNAGDYWGKPRRDPSYVYCTVLRCVRWYVRSYDQPTRNNVDLSQSQNDGLYRHNAGASVISVWLSRLLCASPTGLIRECANKLELLEMA